MKYMGSKNRHSKELLPIILKNRTQEQWYVEPFVGGFNMIDKVDGNRIANDVNYYLIELFKMIQIGWEPPSVVSEEEYNYLRKNNKKDFGACMTGFVGFGCSYSGKWFGGYARGNDKNGNPRNYADESRKNLLKQAENIKGVIIYNKNYLDLEIPEKSIIYCLPEGSLIYQNGTYKPIELVEENSTDLGNANVCIKKHVRETVGEKLISINIMGVSKHYDLKLSKDHIVFIYNNGNILEKRADELTTEDRLLIDYDKRICNYMPKYVRYSSKNKKLLSIDYTKQNEFAELLGIFMAEGHRQNGLHFSFNIKEYKLHERTKFLLKNFFGLDCKIDVGKPHNSVTTVRCHSKELSEYMLLFYNGGTATTKKLNNFVMFWDKEQQLSILKGWLMGDGGIYECKDLNEDRLFKRSGKRNKFKITGTTSSYELAIQMYNIALRCNLHPCFKKRISKRKQMLKNGNNHTTCYDVYFTMKKDVVILNDIEIVGRDCGRRFHVDNFMITKINKITNEEFTGKMYDLTTTKGNFWTFGNIKVHNCDPPYFGTTKYKDEFDHKIFWEWVRKMDKNGHEVFVSEYTAPDDFECLWSKKVNNTLEKDTGSKQGIEKLFKLKK